MAARGTSLDRVGPFNRSVVLDGIRRLGCTTRVQLSVTTGLASQTVTKICRDLLAQGLIVEAGRESVGRGKPRTVLRLAPEGPVALGVHLDPAVVTVALVDLAGTVIDHATQPLTPDQEPADVLRTAAVVAEQIVARAAIAPARTLGMGLAVPGPIDLERGLVHDPPNLPLWHDVPARDLLAAATGWPVRLDKDVTAAAVAEAWIGGVRPDETAAVVHLGTGIGVGMVVNGAVVRGRSGNAGEIGHLSVADDGPRCRCGRRGCVAVVTSPAAMAAAAQAAGITAPPPGAHLSLAMAALFEAADQEADAARLVRRGVDGLARLLLSLVDLLDLDRVVLGGPYWAYFHRHLLGTAAPVTAEGARLTHRVAVTGTTLGDHAGAVGAASLVLDAEVTPDLRRLMSTRPGAEPTSRL